ncbi:sigma-70 family RNA polymerase sigma factor [Spirosoma aerophilum]
MPDNPAEQQLWTRFLAGEESAFQLLMTTYYRALFRYGTRFSRDKEFIKDCIQDLFLYLWERRTSLRTQVVLKPYLMASLRRYMHRHMPDAPASEEFGDDKLQHFNLEFSVEETFIRHETTFNRSRHMQSLLQTLPRRQKEVIYLKFFQEMEREQIAEIMDIAPQTVSNLLQLALRHLRQYWKIELLTLLVVNMGLL